MMSIAKRKTIKLLVKKIEPYTRLVEVIAIFAAIFAFFLELSDRKQERLATMWQLASIESPGRASALEYLNNADQHLARIKVPGAFLAGVQLHGARLVNADLQNTNLADADLSNAQLVNADLSGAVLFKTNLSNADLKYAKLNNAILEGSILETVKNLTQEQLNEVRGTERPPKSLPLGLCWPHSVSSSKLIKCRDIE